MLCIMKKQMYLRITLLFFMNLMFFNCEKIKDLTDVDFDASLKADVSALSSAAVSPELKNIEATYQFSGSAIIDPTSNSDIKKYWKKIRKWEVKKITVRIKNISEPTQLVHGKLTISDSSTETILLEKDATNMPLSNGTVVLTLTGSDWSKIIKALDSKHSLLVKVSGALDKPSVNVTFQVILDLKVTANPLE